jgi:quinoprotein glucose dehydrogenase
MVLPPSARDAASGIANTQRHGGFSEVTPIVVNGVMYMPSGGRVVALEPETGKEIWRHELTDGIASFRGVAYWPGDRSTPPRIIFTSLKRLVALSAITGEPAAGFGTNGEVEMSVAYAGVPIIYKNIIFVGSTIYGPGMRHVDSGVTPAGPPLNPGAYDARTGKELWEFNTVPKPGRHHEGHTAAICQGRWPESQCSGCRRKWTQLRDPAMF